MAIDIFLNLTNIPGESRDRTHPREIEILDFSWGEQNQTMTGLLTPGKVAPQDIRFVKRVDTASPKLLIACATGQTIDQAVLVLRRAGELPLEFLTITLTPCVVASYQVFAENGGDTADERFSLAFGQIKVKYTPQTPTGTAGTPILVAFDFLQNKIP